jgi:hypothetical protein
MKNISFVIFKAFIGLVIYSFFCSLFYSVRLDLINFNINFTEFSFSEIFSMIFLIFFFNFGYGILLLIISFYLIDSVNFLNKYKSISYILFFLIIFITGTFIFDSNFNSTTKSLNVFLHSCLSIFISSIIIYKLEVKFFKKSTAYNNG